MKTYQITDLRQDALDLRKGIFSRDGAEGVISRIKRAVRSGRATWEQIGVREIEFEDLIRICTVNELNGLIRDLRNQAYTPRTTKYIVDKIRRMVRSGQVAWNNININDNELDDFLT